MNHWEMALGAVMVVVLVLVLFDLVSAVREISRSRAERDAFRDLIDRVERMRAITPKDVLSHGDTQIIDLAGWKAKRTR